jgi:hypothetical protein
MTVNLLYRLKDCQEKNERIENDARILVGGAFFAHILRAVDGKIRRLLWLKERGR